MVCQQIAIGSSPSLFGKKNIKAKEFIKYWCGVGVCGRNSWRAWTRGRGRAHRGQCRLDAVQLLSCSDLFTSRAVSAELAGAGGIYRHSGLSMPQQKKYILQ